MARVQSRRTISINRLLDTRIVAEALRSGKTASHWLADAAKAQMQRDGRPFGVKTAHVPRDLVGNPGGANGRRPPQLTAAERRRFVDRFMAGV